MHFLESFIYVYFSGISLYIIFNNFFDVFIGMRQKNFITRELTKIYILLYINLTIIRGTK